MCRRATPFIDEMDGARMSVDGERSHAAEMADVHDISEGVDGGEEGGGDHCSLVENEATEGSSRFAVAAESAESDVGDNSA